MKMTFSFNQLLIPNNIIYTKIVLTISNFFRELL